MTDYSFRVRAIDTNGAFADRDFTITVRNTLVDRVLLIDGSNAYSSINAAGNSWTTRVGNSGVAVRHGGGTWIVFTNGSTIRTSPDAINWTNRTISGLATSGTIYHAAEYANGVWMAIWRTSGSTVASFTSTDGATWTQGGTIPVATPASTVVHGLSYGNGRWFIGDTDANTRMGYYSTDNGATWTQVTSPSGNVICEGSIYIGGRWVLMDSVAAAGRSMVSNNNMTSWTPYNLPSSSYVFGGRSPSSTRATHLIYANGRLFASGISSLGGEGYTTMGYYTSDDGGINWTYRNTGVLVGGTTINSRIVFYNGVFHSIIQGVGNAQYIYSTDGITWTYQTGISSTLADVAVLSA